MQDDLRIKLLDEIESDDVLDRLVVLLRNFNADDCEMLSAKLRLSGREKKNLLFRHSKQGHLRKTWTRQCEFMLYDGVLEPTAFENRAIVCSI